MVSRHVPTGQNHPAPSATSEIAGEVADGTLKIRIAAPPEHGRANAALVALLSQRFNVARSAITIVSGNAESQQTDSPISISAASTALCVFTPAMEAGIGDHIWSLRELIS
jgi:uncharacterized protein YggU (UPF0235/DUF167 family)